jgi:ketosteroid isomerase-like protein
MNGIAKTALFLIGLLVLAACGKSPPDTAGPSSSAPAASSPAPAASSEPGPAVTPSAAADIVAIRAAGASKDSAFNAGNIGSMAAFYEERAVLMPPTVSSAKGQAAIRRYLQDQANELANGGYTSAVASAVDIRVSGDLGVRSGTYTTKDTTGAVVDSGKWLEVWSKSGDGRWLISREISNSDTLPLTLGVPEEEEEQSAE